MEQEESSQSGRQEPQESGQKDGTEKIAEFIEQKIRQAKARKAEAGSAKAEVPKSEDVGLNAEVLQLKDTCARIAAEFDNYRKRTEKEKIEARSAGAAKVLLPLLTFADELELAAKSAEKSEDEKLKAGIAMLGQKFQNFLAVNNVAKIKAEGQAFDHELHEAVMMQDGKEDGKVLFEIQPGYKLNGAVLRHAKVCVSRKPEEKTEGKKENTEGKEEG